MFTVELEFINPFVVTSFTAQVVIKEDSYSLKGTTGPEFRRDRRKTICPSCFVYLPQNRAPPPRNAILVVLVATQCILVAAQIIPTKSRFCIDFMYIRIRTAARSQLSLRCYQCGIKRITKNKNI